MGLFDTVEEMPEGSQIRGLTAEAAEAAQQAIEDGLVRRAPYTQENEALVQSIKRYLSTQGWGTKIKQVGGHIHWQVVEKKQISPEHKAKMLAALQAGRDKRAKQTPKPAEEPAKKAQKAS